MVISRSLVPSACLVMHRTNGSVFCRQLTTLQLDEVQEELEAKQMFLENESSRNSRYHRRLLLFILQRNSLEFIRVQIRSCRLGVALDL